MGDFVRLSGFMVLFFVWLWLPWNVGNTLEVNHDACHIAIRKRYPDSDIKMVKQVIGDSGYNMRQIIYVVDGKFSDTCVLNGSFFETEKRRLIPVEELLGVKK